MLDGLDNATTMMEEPKVCFLVAINLFGNGWCGKEILGYFKNTLENWLQENKTDVLETVVLHDCAHRIAEPLISCNVRVIIRGIMSRLKALHEHHYVHGNLSVQSVRLSSTFDVQLVDPKFEMGNDKLFEKDFAHLKDLIEEILTGPSKGKKKEKEKILKGLYPKDVKHLLDLLGLNDVYLEQSTLNIQPLLPVATF